MRIKDHKPKHPRTHATLRAYLRLQGSAAPSIAIPRPRGRLAVALAFAFFALGISTAAAAEQPHAFTGFFGSPGSGAGQFSFTSESGVAVDQENGDLYVADTGNHRVEKFGPTGAFLFSFGWGVKTGDTSSAGLDTCTTAPPGCQAGFAGHEPGQFEEPTFIAVDNTPGGNGDVYVANEGTGANERETLTVSATGGTYTLSITSPVTGTTTNGSRLVVAEGFGASGPYQVGDAISGPGIPPGTTIVKETGNVEIIEWELSAAATASGTAVLAATATTAPIAFDAPAQGAGSVQAALEALRALGESSSGPLSVSVSGGAGGPYTVEFIGRYTHVDVSQLGANSAGLSGGAATASVATAVDGFDGHGVQKFDSSGNLITSWGGTPDEGQLDGTPCSVAGRNCGTYPFEHVSGVLAIPPLPGAAVKPKGSLLIVASSRIAAVGGTEWTQSSGELVYHPGLSSGEAPIGAAVDPAGHVYLGEGQLHPPYRVIQTSYCDKEDPFGQCPESNAHEGFAYHKNFTLDPGPATSVAVDPSTEDAYVARFNPSSRHSDVAGYDSSGNVLESSFGGHGEITQSAGIAASGFSGSQSDVYVADVGANRVEIFAPGGPQDVLTVTRSGSGLGSVSSVPAGGISCPSLCSAGFLEGEAITLTATAPEHSTFVGWSGGGCAGTGVCQITLTAATAVTATFAHDRPTLTTAEASPITRHTATLTGTVNPEGDASSCFFEYGTTGAYGAQALCPTHPGSSASRPVPVSAELWELATSTTYHYRLVSANSGGSTYGPDQTFTTLGEGCASNDALCPVLPAVAPIVTAALVSPTQPAPTTTTRALTNAQKLAKALKACKQYKRKRARVSCEQQARKRYPAAHKKSRKSLRGGKRG